MCGTYQSHCNSLVCIMPLQHHTFSQFSTNSLRIIRNKTRRLFFLCLKLVYSDTVLFSFQSNTLLHDLDCLSHLIVCYIYVSVLHYMYMQLVVLKTFTIISFNTKHCNLYHQYFLISCTQSVSIWTFSKVLFLLDFMVHLSLIHI